MKDEEKLRLCRLYFFGKSTSRFLGNYGRFPNYYSKFLNFLDFESHNFSVFSRTRIAAVFVVGQWRLVFPASLLAETGIPATAANEEM